MRDRILQLFRLRPGEKSLVFESGVDLFANQAAVEISEAIQVYVLACGEQGIQLIP
jgi:hypothetical protein